LCEAHAAARPSNKLRALKFTILVLVLAMSGAALACPGGYVLRRNQSPLLPRSVGGEKALLKRRRDMNKPHPRNTKALLALFGAVVLVPFIGLAGRQYLSRPLEADNQLVRIV